MIAIKFQDTFPEHIGNPNKVRVNIQRNSCSRAFIFNDIEK